MQGGVESAAPGAVAEPVLGHPPGGFEAAEAAQAKDRTRSHNGLHTGGARGQNQTSIRNRVRVTGKMRLGQCQVAEAKAEAEAEAELSRLCFNKGLERVQSTVLKCLWLW